MGNNILQGVECRGDKFSAHIAAQHGFEIQELHGVRKNPLELTGSSIIKWRR